MMKDPKGAPLLGMSFMNYMANPVNIAPDKFKGLKDLVKYISNIDLCYA